MQTCQLSATGKLHLVSERSLIARTTVCGRTIAQGEISSCTSFDGDESCSLCWYKSKIAKRVQLPA